MDLKRLKTLLEKYGQSILNEMLTRLQSSSVRGTSYKNPGVATGSLRDSLSYQVKPINGGLSLEFSMLEYGVYVDKGRKPGKQPPLDSIKEWCRIKGIDEQAAFPIARHIGKYGIPATNFFTIPLKRRQEQMKEDIAKLMQQLLQEEANKIIE